MGHFIGTLSGSDQSPGSSSGERGVPASHSPEEGGGRGGGDTKGGGKLIWSGRKRVVLIWFHIKTGS